MYYILNSDIALRSWWLVPFAYYSKKLPTARPLSKTEFENLLLCDGKHNIVRNHEIENLLHKGFIFECNEGEKRLAEWQKYKSYDNRYFPKMNWMITGKCNYNCLHCFNAKDNTPIQSEWEFSEAEELIRQAADCGIHAITITGGEPFIHRDFIAIINSIYEHGMFVEEINTNGFFINQEILDVFKSIKCYPVIKISFDGIGFHDWMRNHTGAEKSAIEAVSLCVKNGFRVKIQTNINRHNLSSIYDTVCLLDKLGVEETRLIRTTDTPRWQQNSNNETLPVVEYFEEVLKIIVEYIKAKHYMKINAWQFMSINPNNRTYVLNPIQCNEGEYRDSIPVCKANRAMISIAADGTVYPCHQISGFYKSKSIAMPNVKVAGLKRLLQYGEYLNNVCLTVGELRKANSKCDNCKYFEYCIGGCRAAGFIYTDNPIGSDLTKCSFFENNYPEKIKYLMKGWECLSIMEAYDG